MDLAKVATGKNPPHEVNVVIEVPLGGYPVKYEIDKDSSALFVDRFLHTSMVYPCNYGFIPHTLSGDGDPCDVLVVSEIPVVPGCIIACRPIGVLMMKDESGEDEKILAVPITKLNPFYEDIKSYRDLPVSFIEKISHFFEHYKDLEKNKWVKVTGWGDAETAHKLIQEAQVRAMTSNHISESAM
jgi:inorganic pyrophosphatase